MRSPHHSPTTSHSIPRRGTIRATVGALATLTAATVAATFVGAPAASAHTTSTPPATNRPAATAARLPLAGVVIGVDPGHNAHTPSATCTTTGTSTNTGYPEHTHNWAVAADLRADLQALGATVVMTRPNDIGVGPCVTDRARALNSAHTTVNVSIHADGNTSPDAHGFHVIYNPHPTGAPTNTAETLRLAYDVRDAYRQDTGLAYSTYVGDHNALSPRTDLAVTNMAVAPTVLLEAGNMRNPHDAALLSTPAFHIKEAAALTLGLRRWLHR